MNKEYYLEYIYKDNKHSESKTDKYKIIYCEQNNNKNKLILLKDIIKNAKDFRILKGIILGSKYNC